MPAVQHMVLLKFKPGVSSKTIDNLFAQLAELQSPIPGIARCSSRPSPTPTRCLSKGRLSAERRTRAR